MRRPIAIGISCVAEAVFTHGIVSSAMTLDEPAPPWTYRGSFQRVALATERLWSYAHGWQPTSHIRGFGVFYAAAVHLLCPLLGFALFCILSRHKLGLSLWKPLALAVPLALAPLYAGPWLEAGRTLLIMWLMLWVAGAARFPSVPGVRRAPA